MKTLEQTEREILELFCGVPIDCETEAQIRLTDILKKFFNTTLSELLAEGEELKEIPVKTPHHSPYISGKNEAIKLYQQKIKDKMR